MPYIRDVAVTEFQSTATVGGTAEMPVHQSGDILIFMAVKDGTGAITQTGAVYTALQSGASAGAWGGAWWRRATSANEAGFVGTWTADSAVYVTIAVAEVHATNAPTSVRNAADDTNIPFSATGTLNSASNNSLVIYGCFADAVSGPTPYPTNMQVLYAGDSGEAGLGVGWAFFPTSGSDVIAGKNFFGGTVDEARIITVAIEDISGGGTVTQARVDPSSTSPSLITPLTGASIATDARLWTLPVALTHTIYGNDFLIAWNDNAGAFTNITAALNSATTADVTPTNNTNTILYFGSAAAFDQMALAISTAGTGSPAATWEYWNGSAWATLTGITTGVAGDLNFTATGTKVYRWVAPTNWASTSVNGTSAFYIRRRQTANWTVGAVLSIGAVNGMGALFDAVAATADSGANPYHTSNALSGPATVPDITNQAGSEFLSGTAIDMDPGYLLTRFRYVSPRDGIDAGLYKSHKGVSFGLIDTSNNYKMWTVAAKDATDSSFADAAVIGIQPAQTVNTAWAARNLSGSFNANVIDTVITTGSSAFAALACQFSGLYLVNSPVIVVGGSTTNKLAFADINKALFDGCSQFPVVVRSGSAATYYVPIQLGGPSASHFEVSLSTFQFPTKANAALRTGTWHVDDGTVGVEFFAAASENCKFTACTFISGSPYYWRFNASHSASSLTDFAGTTVVNAQVTLRSTVTLSTVTFQNCPTFTLNGADLNSCRFVNTTVDAAIGDVSGITNSTFSSPDAVGHGLVITGTAADISLTGNQFTGFAGVNGSTGNEAIYVNIASGTMTINILGGGSTPSVRTAGATVTVVNAVTVSVTATDTSAVPVVGARVSLEAAAGGALPALASVTSITRSGATATVTTGVAHNLVTGNKVVIRGANEPEYNGGSKVVTVTSTTTFTYTVSGTPATPATGTITCTAQILDGDTDGSGVISNTGFAFTANQPVVGRVRRGTSVTRYKTGIINGTITSSGFAVSVPLVSDE